MTPKTRPGTGDTRKTKQPLKIDLLPPAVHEAILALKNQMGKSWQEIEEYSALPPDTENPEKGGFVNWLDLPLHILEKFPDMRLPHSNLQRWYDIRVTQVQSDVLHRAAKAREIAKAFAKGSVPGSEQAVMNAGRDVILGMLSEDSTEDGRTVIAKALLKLAEVQQKARTNDIRERVVSVEERRIVQLEKDAEIKRARMQTETETVAKKLKKGELTIDDLNRLRRNTFGLPPLTEDGKEVTQ